MEHQLPNHIAVVMDGNGRWAESRGLERVEGHIAGVESLKKLVDTCLEKKIACLSLFAFSSENWLRPLDEVNFLMDLFVSAIQKELAVIKDKGIQMRFTGDRKGLPLALQNKMQEAENLTVENQHLILNIVFNYGGKWDLVNAAKQMTQAVMNGELALADVNETNFALFLNTHGLPDPDLLIRTSGELRLSNFFLWQLAYTELYFTEIHWPDFDSVELEKALLSFSRRKRRFGQIL